MNEEKATIVAGSGDLLIGALPVEAGRISSRHILKAPGVRMVRLALDAGQVLSEHTAAVPVLIQVLAGRIAIDADGESTELPSGAIIYLAARLPHSVEALEPAQLTLTLLDGYEAVKLGHGTGQSAARKPEREQPQATAPRQPERAARQAPAPLAPPEERASIANHVVLSSSGADAAAVDAVTRRHAELSGTLAAHSSHLLEAAASGDETLLEDARGRLVEWSHSVLIPQFTVEAGVLYPAADSEDGTALVGELRDGLERIGAALEGVATLHEPADVAASAVSLRVAVGHQLRAETERLLPLLAASPRQSLAALWSELWAELDRIVPEPTHQQSGDQHASDRHTPDQLAAAAVCECGIVDEPLFPELDVRTVPHAIRHATVFGALDAIGPGGGLVLVAPHDPLPLLAQIEQRTPGRFGVSYLQRGPEDWRLQLTHTGADG